MSPIKRREPHMTVCIVCWCALFCGGCSARNELDAVESELRQKEQAQESLEIELQQTRAELNVARNDAKALRTQLSKNHLASLTEEQAGVLYRAVGIKFSPLLTSGQDRDGRAGDEGLAVMLIPVDEHGDLVKLAGELELELFDMAQSGDSQRLGLWKFSTEEVREHWRHGIVGSGYQFQIDWQNAPVSSDLTLHARLSLPDGKKFNATTQVKVNPPEPARLAIREDASTGPEVTSDRWDVDSIPTLR